MTQTGILTGGNLGRIVKEMTYEDWYEDWVRSRPRPSFVSPGASPELLVLAHFGAEWQEEAEALPRWRFRRRRKLLTAANVIQELLSTKGV